MGESTGLLIHLLDDVGAWGGSVIFNKIGNTIDGDENLKKAVNRLRNICPGGNDIDDNFNSSVAHPALDEAILEVVEAVAVSPLFTERQRQEFNDYFGV